MVVVGRAVGLRIIFGVVGLGILLGVVQRSFEFTLRLAQVLGQLRKLCAAEQHDHDHQQDQQLRGSEIHRAKISPRPSGRLARPAKPQSPLRMPASLMRRATSSGITRNESIVGSRRTVAEASNSIATPTGGWS